MVGELLLEEPPAEVVHYLDGQGGVLAVEVPLLHLLEHVGEHPVHHQRQGRCTVGLAEFLALLDLVESVAHVDDELAEEPEGVLAELILDLEEELPQDVVDGCCVGVVDLMLILLLVLLPVLSYIF